MGRKPTLRALVFQTDSSHPPPHHPRLHLEPHHPILRPRRQRRPQVGVEGFRQLTHLRSRPGGAGVLAGDEGFQGLADLRREGLAALDVELGVVGRSKLATRGVFD
jgi:hypothetical protein